MATVADAAAEVAAIESAGAPSLPADTASDDASLSAPLREDQVANAVSFLTSPKVAPASTEQKRSFLIKKGLTVGEIDEAFRRAPDAPAAAVVAPAPGVPLATSVSPYAAPSPLGQQQAYVPPMQQLYTQQQQQQPGGTYQPQPMYSQQQLPQQQGNMLAAPGQQLQVAGPPPGPRWTSVVLGLTAIAAGGYGLQRLVVPWVREYYERWAAARQNDGGSAADGKLSGKALTAEEQGSASTLADAIRVQTEGIAALLPALQAALAELKDMRKQAAAQSGAMDFATLRADLRADVRSDLRAELRTFVESINELSADTHAPAGSPMSSTYGTPQRSAATSPAPSKDSQGDRHSGSRNGGYHGAAKGATANGMLAHDDAPSFATPAAGPLPAPGTRGPPSGSSSWLRNGGGSGGAPGAGWLSKPWERAQPADDTPPAFAQQAGPAPWQRDASPPQARHQAGRAGSVASSVSEAGADEAQPWRPPPVPQPSIPLPRRRSAAPPPAPASPDHNHQQGAAAVAAAEPLPGLPAVPRGPSPFPPTPEQTADSVAAVSTPSLRGSAGSQETAPVTPDVENARAERDAKQPGAASGSAASDGSEQQLQAPAAEATSEITPAPMKDGDEDAQPGEEA